MPPHTFECFSFLLPHTFHWKNIYTKAKAIKPLQICESEKNQKDRKKETEASWKLIPTHGWKSAAQIFGRWLRVFHMPKRFILFSFRFVSTGFFFLHAAFLYWQPASDRDGERAMACLWKTHDFCVQHFFGALAKEKSKRWRREKESRTTTTATTHYSIQFRTRPFFLPVLTAYSGTSPITISKSSPVSQLLFIEVLYYLYFFGKPTAEV